MSELTLPNDWCFVDLAVIADVIDPHPSHRAPIECAQGIPFAGIGDLDEYGNLRVSKVRRVSADIYEEHVKRYKITSNTIGFGRVASIGKIVDFKGFHTKVTISPTLAIVEPKKVEKKYLVNALKSLHSQKQISLLLTGSTRSSLGIALLRELVIPLPPIPEQQKIAQILTSVDEVIEKTQAQIDKLKDLKTAMMQELLTKGVCDENGKRHVEFKNSPVGRIPVGWEVVTLEEIISTMAGGVSVNSENKPKVTGELGILKTSAVAKGEFKPSENKVVLQNEYERLRTPVLADHIIFSRMNTPTLVGESGYVSRDYGDLFLPDRLWQIDVQDRNKTSVLWLSYVLSSDKFKAEISELATGTSNTMKNISKPKLLGIRIAYPKLNEQAKIAASLQSLDKKLDISNHKLKKNKSLKKALMQDLLTGNVRVNTEQSDTTLAVG